jgi:hypothetical protein
VHELGRRVQHVDLGELELAVDVGLVHGLEASRAQVATAAKVEAGVAASVEALRDDSHELLARGVPNQDVLRHGPSSLCGLPVTGLGYRQNQFLVHYMRVLNDIAT